MHYRHAYHAANFADVFKHTLWLALLEALLQKDAPLAVYDIHAGAGLYDLTGFEANQTQEWQAGIAKLQDQSLPDGLPEVFRRYALFCQNPRHYPGSPALAAQVLRSKDKLLLWETHVADALHAAIKALDPAARYAVQASDGYQAFSHLPEKRLLMLIDPPFERSDEFDCIHTLLEKSLQRCRHGVYVVWYPYKKRFDTERFLRKVQALPHPMLNFWLDNGEAQHGQMHACGLLVINPPFAFRQQAEGLCEALKTTLTTAPMGQASVQLWNDG
jgi:23S rRNA (adenine2030-N6)-methyltransferase